MTLDPATVAAIRAFAQTATDAGLGEADPVVDAVAFAIAIAGQTNATDKGRRELQWPDTREADDAEWHWCAEDIADFRAQARAAIATVAWTRAAAPPA